MTQVSRINYRQYGSYVLALIAFIAVSYAVRLYQDDIRFFLGNADAWSVPLFLFFTIVFVVFVIPLDIVFLIPIAASLWGPVATGFLMIIGWTLGSGIAFLIARRYGLPVVERLVGADRVSRVANRIPQGELFWSIVFLRMTVPVDVLSYALGLFSTLGLFRYLFATLIGITPFAFFFSFAGVLPLGYQFVALAAALLVAAVLLMRYGKQHAEKRVSDYDQNRSAHS